MEVSKSLTIIGVLAALLIGFINLSYDINSEDNAGAFIQGPSRVFEYQNYLLLDLPNSEVGSAISGFNGTGAIVINSTGYRPDYPRNVMLNRSCSETGKLCTSGAISVSVTGPAIGGDNRTETISLGANSTANGSIAFYNVTSVVWPALAANESVGMGYGNKLGLPNLIKSKNDVLGVSIVGTGGLAMNLQTINVSYNTIQISTNPDSSKDYVIYYKGYGVVI